MQEEREFQQRLLALAGIGPAGGGGTAGGGGGAGAEGEEEGEEGYLSEDEVDPDDLSYEEVGRLQFLAPRSKAGCCLGARRSGVR